MIKLETVVVTPISENCYILHDGKDAVVIDAGGDFELIDEILVRNKLTVKYLLNTHGHFDHIGAVSELKEKYHAPFCIHKLDEELVAIGKDVADSYGILFPAVPQIDRYLEDGEIINFAGLDIKVIHTPGHSMGGVCFYIASEKLLFTGDTLFYGSIGRTDFPQSSYEYIISSIKEKLYTLDDDTLVYAGHGRSSSIGHEKSSNPFINDDSV